MDSIKHSRIKNVIIRDLVQNNFNFNKLNITNEQTNDCSTDTKYKNLQKFFKK